MDLALYRAVGTLNRVALGDLANGVEFYTATKDAAGVVTLTPVRVVGARSAPAAEPENNSEGAVADAPDAPWAP